MARETKRDPEAAVLFLSNLTAKLLPQIKYFSTGHIPVVSLGKSNGWQLQCGILRSNCIDCLDRTNAAQSIIGTSVLKHQLHALGLISDPLKQSNEIAVSALAEMYLNHGNTIAWQYGGSELVNTVDSYTKPSPWKTHSRDFVNKVRRYYSNSFTDADKQDSIDLFLGNVVPWRSLHVQEATFRYQMMQKVSLGRWVEQCRSEFESRHSDLRTEIRSSDGVTARRACKAAFARFYEPGKLSSFCDLYMFRIPQTWCSPGDRPVEALDSDNADHSSEELT